MTAPTLTETVAAAVVAQSPTPQIAGSPTPEPTSALGTGQRLPLEAIVGGAGLLLVLGYIVLYLRGLGSSERYASGFVIRACPVCHRGELIVEARHDRVLGIPRTRRTVRCSVCRSVLRETGSRRWRYAVDRIENPTVFERYNGREIDDRTLQSLAEQPLVPAEPRPRMPTTPPTFVDDEDQS